jgi:3-methyladenine DNA glycosylase AlkD
LSKSGTLFPSILTSKQVLEKINYLDENTPSFHEWDTAIRLAKYCRFIHIQEPLFIYNIHKNTISKNSDISVVGYQYIINKFKDDIKELCGEDVFTNHLIINSVMALNNDEYTLGRAILKQIPNKYIKKSILYLSIYLRIKPIYFTKIKQLFSRKI